MKPKLLSLLIGSMFNATGKPKGKADYYKISNQAGRNIITLDNYIGYWDDDAAWFKYFLREHDGEAIDLVISSIGGEVFTGQSMYNSIKAHNGTVTCYVEKAFSIASHIAMACDVVNIVKGGQMMIHAVSGQCTGTDHDMLAYAELMRNAKTAIANSYADKTGHAIDYWLDVMKNDAGKYFSDQECIDLGLADSIIEPSSMTNFGADNIETGETEDEPEPTEETPEIVESVNTVITSVITPVITTIENSVQDNTMSELKRQKAVRNLFNQLQVKLRLPLTLLNAALDDEACDISAATTMFATHTPEQGQEESAPVNFGGNHGGSGSDAKNMIKNVLLNRAGCAELKNEYRDQAGMTMLDAARAMGVKGNNAALAQNAIDSDDFKALIGEIPQEVVKLEAENNWSLIDTLCEKKRVNRLGNYGVSEFNQLDGLGIRDSNGNFPEINISGKPKRTGNVIERGSQILLTRAALLDDDFSMISTLPRTHTRAAFRSAETLIFQRIREFAATHAVTAADINALILVMRTHLQSQTTSKGDDLRYNGGLLIATPNNMNYCEPLIKSARTTDINAVNPVFNAFQEFLTATNCQDLFMGVAAGHKALEIALIQGMERPELIENNSVNRANGIGWTMVWDYDIQVSDSQALVVGKIGSSAQVKAFQTKQAKDAVKVQEAQDKASAELQEAVQTVEDNQSAAE